MEEWRISHSQGGSLKSRFLRKTQVKVWRSSKASGHVSSKVKLRSSRRRMEVREGEH